MYLLLICVTCMALVLKLGFQWDIMSVVLSSLGKG